MVKNEFTKKSIGTLTLGEKLRKVRSEKRISLADVSKSTKIQMKYLEFLEEGTYEKLPADVYVKGFLRSFAQQAGINENVLIKLYERERDINKNIGKIDSEEHFVQPISISRFSITPKIFFFALIGLLIFSGFYYLYREANLFVSTARLVILEPNDNMETSENKTIVKGVTDRDSQIYINEKAVLVDADGNFSEDIGLREGTNTIVIKSVNKFEKESTKVVSIKSTYQNSAIPESSNDKSTEERNLDGPAMKMELSVGPEPTWISVEADGALMYSGILNPNTPQMFEAKDNMIISSDKGNNTHLKINGKEEKLLSDSVGAAKNVTFNAGDY